MRIIDAHLHVMERNWVPYGVRLAWARQASGRRLPMREPLEVEPNVMRRQSDPNAELTMKAFDRCGVEGGLIPVVDWSLVGIMDSHDLTIDEIHACYRQLHEDTSGRLRYCAGIDPRQKGAADRMVRELEQPGCSGIKIYPAAGWRIADDSHRWIFELAVELDSPVVVHTSPLGGDPIITPYSRPAEIAPMMAAFPTLQWVFAHAGYEAWWAEAADIASGWRSVYLDLSLWQGTATTDYAEFRRRMRTVLARVGAHRVLFGSDIIRGSGEDPNGDHLKEWIDLFVGLGESYAGDKPVATEEQIELMMGANAASLYGFN